MLIVLQQGVSADELKDLFDDVKHFVFDLVKDPLIDFSAGQNSGVFQINQMTGRFRLGKVQNLLQITDAHFAIGHDQVENPETGGVGTGQKNLCTRVNIEVFKSHFTP